MTRSDRTAGFPNSDYDALVGSVYDAALGAVAWETVLPDIVRFMGGERGSFGIRSRGDQSQLVITHEMDPELLALWRTELEGYDPWAGRFSDRLRPGEILHGASEAFFGEVRELEIFSRFYAPAGVVDLLATNLVARGEWRGYLGVYRGLSDPFEESDVARARRLAPHLVRAASIHDRIGALADSTRASQEVLESIPYGVILLDAGGAVAWANRAADGHLQSDSPFRLRNGVLQARDSELQAKLTAALAAASRGVARNAPLVSQRVALARGGKQGWLEVALFPIGPRSGEAVLLFGGARPMVAVVLADPALDAALPAETLRTVLELPPSLARLASATSAGSTIAEYAEQAGITEGTARQQMKELLARVGARGQVELARILQRGVAALKRG